MTGWEEESGCLLAQAQHSGYGEADPLRRIRINLFPVAQRGLYTLRRKLGHLESKRVQVATVGIL